MGNWIRKMRESDAGRSDAEKVKMLVKAAEDGGKKKLKLPTLPCEGEEKNES